MAVASILCQIEHGDRRIAVRAFGCVSIALEGDGGNGDHRTCGKAPFQIVVLQLSFGQAQPPAVVVDHDADMIRVVERLLRYDRTWLGRTATSAT